MPMHDWKRVPKTIYHPFHQRWTISICDALNAGLLPQGYSALVEQYSSGVFRTSWRSSVGIEGPPAGASRRPRSTFRARG